MDDLRTVLAEMAPPVDTDAALEAFRARRLRDRWRRRIGTVLALVAVAGLAGVALAAAAGRDDRSTERVNVGADPASDESTLVQGRDFVVNASILGGPARPGALSASQSESEIEAMRRSVSLATPHEFDASTVVLTISVADQGCPDDLLSFTRVRDVITPVFDRRGSHCANPPDTNTFVVVLTPPASLGPAFTVRLPADPPHYGERRLRVELAAAPSTTAPDRQGDITAIRAAFLGWIGATPKGDVGAYVEDYDTIRDALQQGIEQHSSADLAGYSGRLETISGVDADHYDVTYSVLHDGAVQFADLPGRAVRVDGVWKVSRDTVCDLLARGGITCPG